MHCLCRVSLRVNAATSRTMAKGTYRQPPSAATMYTPHLRYSAAIRGPALSFVQRTELESPTLTPQLSPPGY